jgi:hypothetical protein
MRRRSGGLFQRQRRKQSDLVKNDELICGYHSYSVSPIRFLHKLISDLFFLLICFFKFNEFFVILVWYSFWVVFFYWICIYEFCVYI